MKKIYFVVATTVGALTFPACGGEPGPVAPSRVAGTGLTIVGSDAILTGSALSYTVTASLTNGATQIVTPTWTSSDSGVATVDTTGRVTGRSHGSFTLTAAYQGDSTSKTVQVVNDYVGNWSGTYVIRACDASFNGVRSACGEPRVGSVHNLDLVLFQTGQDWTQVSGWLYYFSYVDYQEFGVPLTGHVTSDGRLLLAGEATAFDWWRGAIGGWETWLVAADEMRGRWSQEETYTPCGAPSGSPCGNYRYYWYWETELASMTRTRR